jgi:hypothetical protein
MNEVLPAGAATLIAIYSYSGAGDVWGAVVNAAKTSVAEIDGKSVKDLKAGLAEAQAGMGRRSMGPCPPGRRCAVT